MTNQDMMGIRQRVTLYRSSMDHKSADHKGHLIHACEIIDELLAELERLTKIIQIAGDNQTTAEMEIAQIEARIKELEKRTHLLDES